MSGRVTRLPAPRGGAGVASLLAALALAELIALLLAFKPAFAFLLTGACVVAATFLYIQRPAVFWIASLPVVPFVNYAIFVTVGTGAAIATAAVLALVWVSAMYRGIAYRGPVTWLDAAVGAFAVLVLISTIRTSGGSGDAWRTFIGAILPGAMAYFALRRVFSASDFALGRLWWAFATLTAIIALMGIFEGVTGHDLLSFTGGVLPVSGVEGVSRVNGPFPTDIEFGLTLVMGIALLLSRWGESPWETPASRRMAAGVLVLASAAVYFTYFRTTWGITLLLVFLWMRRRGWTTAAVIMVVGAVCLALLGGQLPRLEQSSIVQTRVLSGDNVSTRIATNQKAIDIFKDRPIVGIGWNNFAADLRVVEVNGIENVDTPHNAFLGVLAELGLVGGVLFAGAIGAVVLGLVRLRRASDRLPPDADWLLRGFIWVPILFLVFSLDFQTLTLPYPVLLFFGCGGIAAALASRRQAQ